MADSFEPSEIVFSSQSSSSAIAQSGVSVLWSTNCPNASISDPTILAPTLTLPSFGAGALPTVCQITLAITVKGITKTVDADVSVVACPKDCNNTVLGTLKVDACGTCGGNGAACISCQSVSVTPQQVILDGRAASLRTSALRLTKRLPLTAKTSTEKVRLAKEAKKATLAANTLYQAAWQTIYTEVPSTIVNCPQEKFCVESSNVTAKTTYSENIAELEKIIRSLARKVQKKQTFKKTVNKILKVVEKDLALTTKALAEIPNANSVCS